MRKNSQILILGFILSFPFMMLFQNCGKFQKASDSSLATNASIVDTNDLPLGSVSIDQTMGSSTAQAPVPKAMDTATSDDSTDRISIYDTLVDPEKESLQDIEDAKNDCQLLQSSSNASGDISTNQKSISGLSGRNVLSSADFGGSTEIESIQASFGILVLCGLNVKNISNSGGKLILIQDSKVESVSSFYGEIFVVDAARALIGNSKVEIHKQ